MAPSDRSEAAAAPVPAVGPHHAGLRALRLSRRAKRGERAAFEEIFRSHHQELYRYCLAILHDRDDAEDALQTTMATALRTLPGEEREIEVRPWLFRVAHNESISLLRKRRNAGAGGEVEHLECGVSPETELATRERLRGLVADLGELPERQRSAIVMRELSGLDYAEIGSALSCSEGAARQAVYEARSALRESEEGRGMDCEDVRMAISDRDGRRLRSRKLHAHLKACDGCRGFAASISRRRADLQALYPPLPAAVGGAMLSGLLGAGGGSGGAAAATGSGLAASAAIKGGSLAAAVAITVGAADVGGVIDLPDPVGGSGSQPLPKPKTGSSPADIVGGGRAARRPGPSAVSDRGSGVSGGSGRGATRGSTDSGSVRDAAAPGPHADGEFAPAQSGGSAAADGSGGGSATAPGQTGDNPGGGTASAPGQTGVMPGNASTAPGHTGASPGNSSTAPGQTGSTPAATGTAGSSAGSSSGSGGRPGDKGPNGSGRSAAAPK